MDIFHGNVWVGRVDTEKEWEKINAFKYGFGVKLLRVPQTARRTSNSSWIK